MPSTKTRVSAVKPVTDYKELHDLRHTDPAALVRMHREGDQPDQPLARFLRRMFAEDGAWAEVDWDAVARSVEQDAAEIERILAEYPATVYLDDEDGDGDGERRCAVCAAGDICRTAFATDADDVASEADAPLADVLRWMHQNELHSNVESVSVMADRFHEEWAAGILMRRAALEEMEDVT